MPRSKRDKKVSLTKVEKKKALISKQALIDKINKCVEYYPNIFVFAVQNIRNNLLKDLRAEMKHSRFFFAKNRIMQLGLGKTSSEEAYPDLHKLSERLKGQRGLLFTHKSKEDILEWAKNYWAIEYAKSGFIATETVVLKEGKLEDFSHAIEPHLRSLGLPTKLDKGFVTLYKDHTVCEAGKMLTPEQARILKLIAKPMAKFKLTITCSWTKDDGFESYIDDNHITEDNFNNDEMEMEVEK